MLLGIYRRCFISNSLKILNKENIIVKLFSTKSNTPQPKEKYVEAVKKHDKPNEACGPIEEDDELADLEEMFIKGPAGMEWNGPTRGGKRPEPTRYGDWERKGRCSDF
eukprot:gene9139-12325_t